MYLPRPVLRLRLGCDGAEDGAEGAVAREARGIDDGADGGLAVCGPHGAVAVGDLPLNDGRAQRPLTPVVGRLDAAGMVEEVGLPPWCGGGRSDYHAAARRVIASM